MMQIFILSFFAVQGFRMEDFHVEEFLPLLISNLIVIAIFLFFQVNNTKTIRHNQQHIATMEARSLREQMNPHFIFNAINTLQSIVILKDERYVNQYIGLLSKVLRYTLDLNFKEEIRLKDEIDYLNAYVAFQKIRLEDQLDYKIMVHPNIPVEEVKLPPMLIQPIIENAILHGLTPKLIGRKLRVIIKKRDADVSIVVLDNGIGRAASQKINRKYRKTHKSYATQILRERINIHNYFKRHEMEFKLTDLKNGKVPAGTRAQLKLKNVL